jgi:multisubunit Na+/H+ antiporter MnhF subunit
MNEWLWFAAGLLILLAPCAAVALRGDPTERLLGSEMGAAITSLALVALAEGFHRSIYADLALVFAVMSFVSTLVFLHFLERWV